jgi:hypothetical protein
MVVPLLAMRHSMEFLKINLATTPRFDVNTSVKSQSNFSCRVLDMRPKGASTNICGYLCKIETHFNQILGWLSGGQTGVDCLKRNRGTAISWDFPFKASALLKLRMSNIYFFVVLPKFSLSHFLSRTLLSFFRLEEKIIFIVNLVDFLPRQLLLNSS